MSAQYSPESSNPGEAPLTDHAYDGIMEYDNPTPGWWSLIFIVTVLLTPMYLVYFHSRPDERSILAAYDASRAANLRLKFGKMGTLVADERTLLKFMQDEEGLAIARATFLGNCSTCHGKEGEGITGPNMTDDSYLNVKTLTDIPQVIRLGAKAGAMPAWENRLHPNEIVLAAAYMASLRGKNLPSTRPAEGTVIPPWPTATTAPTVK